MAHKIIETDNPKVKNIELVRGDTFITDFTFKKGDNNYTPESGDYVYFTMRKNYKGLPNDDILIQKQIVTELELEPEDTENLEYGSYKYDCEFNYADGRRDTFLSGSFKLVKEVT